MDEINNSDIIDFTTGEDPKKIIEERIRRLKEEGKKVVATSGYFDPIHVGHIELFEKAKELGDYLIIILNSNDQAMQKKGFYFMHEDERLKIIEKLKMVDEVIVSIDKDQSQCDTLAWLKPHIFAKGGDRYTHEIPETPICREHGIEIIDGLGAKIQSSSDLIKRSKEQEENKKLNN